MCGRLILSEDVNLEVSNGGTMCLSGTNQGQSQRKKSLPYTLTDAVLDVSHLIVV